MEKKLSYEELEQRIEEAEEYFAFFADNPIETIVVDLDGRVVKYNKVVKHAAGKGRRSRLPEIGDKMYVDYGSKHQIDMRKELMTCISEKKTGKFTEMLYDNNFIDIRIVSTEKGAIILLIDVTEQKQAKEALKKSEEKYRLLAENISDVIWTLDMEMKYTYVSPSIVRMCGYSVKEVLGQSIKQSMAPDSFKSVMKIIAEEMELQNKEQRNPHSSRKTEAELFCKDGSTVWVEIEANFIFNLEGQLEGVIGVTRNITERKQAEESFLRLERLESLGILAGGIAHDFNNLLAGIMGNTSIALLNNNPKKQEELLQKVIKASEKATSLTQQLLTFAKGGIPSTKIASIAKVIKESVNLALGQSSQTKCKLTLPDDLWLSEMDVGQIDQVFQNLIINAKQAMPEGGIVQIRAENVEITSDNSYHLAPGGFVHILVKDNGIGVPEKYLQKIFDPYFSTKDNKKEKGGSGLGLAVSHSVIQKHGGYIYANSKRGKGTTFHIYLPADRDAVLEKESVEESSKAAKSLKILVMDDNTMVLDLMEAILENLGHQFVLSKHGAEAVEKYQEAFGSEEKFDLAILDLTIPGGMGGVETLEELKKIDPNVKVIISSGYSDQVPNGFAGVLSKPYKIKDLVKVLEEVMMWS
ncbi:MAG: PAS domain S-box protein [Patescibacteria group bacterium]|nr:PAS domain S-box protein [Patescibacteria group bacterium]